jgi:hypothetical protein
MTQANRFRINRRDFFKLGALGPATLALGSTGCDLVIPASFGVTLVRPKDLVALEFEFIGLALEKAADGSDQLVATTNPGGLIVVHFQPQHVFEEALLENPTPPAPLEKPVDARIAGRSRVVLRVPAGSPAIPLTSEALLEALHRLEMNVAPNALPPPPRVISPGVIADAGSFLDVRSATRTRNLAGAEERLAISSGLEPRAALAEPAFPTTRVASATATDVISGAATSDIVAVELPPGIVLSPEDQLIFDEAVINPRPRLPLNVETALELPYRLILSPNHRGGWAHRVTADAGKKHGRHELWHTRLGVRDPGTGAVSERPSYLRTVRAIWSRDMLFDPDDPSTTAGPTPPEDEVFGVGTPTSLVPADRVEIVHLSSNFRDLPGYTPKPIDTNRLMLTTLGGWLDSHADFTLDTPLNLVSWDHKAALGRDYFVKVVRKGRLFPWGHFAVKIEITERKFRAPDTSTAYLWKRTFILVREPVRSYPESWRKFPFQSIHVKTLVTPNLYAVPAGNVPTHIKIDAATPFRFKIEALDREGNLVHFDAVATWVPQNGASVLPNHVRNPPNGAADLYEAYGDHRLSKLDGQRVAYSKNKKSDDTTYETTRIFFDGTVQGEQAAGLAFPSVGVPYVVGVGHTDLNVEAIRHLVGQSAPTPFQYHLTYLKHGFPPEGSASAHANRGELLFQVKEGLPPVGLNFSKKSDSSGGFVAPSLQISGLSRKTGPVSGSKLDDIAANKFDPKEFLKSIDALIFGVIPLSDIFALVTDAAGGLDAAPSFITQSVDAVTGFLDDLAAFRARIEETAGDIDDLRDKIDEVLAAIRALVGSSDLETAITNAETVIDQLDALIGSFLGTVDGLPNLLFAAKQDVKRRGRSIQDVLDAVKTGLRAFATGLDMAKNLTVKLEWRAPLQPDPAGFFVPNPTNGGFLLAVEARAKQVGKKPPGVDVIAGIENFDVNVFGTAAKLVTIPFERLVFKVESGKKPDVDVVFKGGVGFDGVLAFVETLSKLIPSQGFSDPPALEVDSEGIRSSFSIPIPSVTVGVFSLQNISIGAGFEVPFIGNPLNVSFNFCTRDEPFILTVMCIGGGGFFGIKLCPRGLLLLEAAFEARAQLALDFGVASGSVSIAVGVYFRLEQVGSNQEGSLTGYIRIHGEVDVLGGLISASITLLLELIYEFSSGKLIGRATLTIEVSICFFSFSVEVTCERRLSGSAEDPTFVDQMGDYTILLEDGTEETVHPWSEYCESFVLAA